MSAKSISLIVLSVTLFHASYCQKRTPFEDVTMEEVKMTSYELDSTASAVILKDLGYFQGTNFRFTRKMRVKILTKAGLDWGNWTFNTPSRSDIKVVVHNLVDGKIVSEKADSKSIHTEKVVDQFEVYKVFAPNVRTGSVVDITYSFDGLPFEWRFQERIPVAFSELVVEETTYVSFKKTHYGFQPIETISPWQWRARSMPAFRMEPFLNTYTNYITKFEFQVEGVGAAGRGYFAMSTTWREVTNVLLESTYFGKVITDSPFLNDFAKETKAKNLSKKDRIQAAYNYIRRNLKWDGRSTAFASREIWTNFKTNHNGNSADINLSLIGLLNKLDIKTYPIVLSTRDNGLLLQFSPTISKLDYVVAYVQEDDFEMFLDATSENIGSPGMLPARCLNGEGLLVKKDNEQWFSLNRAGREVRKQLVNITMESSGSVKARVIQDYTDYGYLSWADDLKANNNDAEIRKNNLQKENPDVSILSYEITKRDSMAMNGKETLEIDLSNQLINTGTDFIFNPFVLFEYASNPFKSEERNCPVDLTYPRERNTTILVQLPKEYGVKQMPPSMKYNNTDGSATFTYLASASGNTMQFRVVLKLNKHIFSQEEYKELRVFFSEVAKKVNTPIELIKT